MTAAKVEASANGKDKTYKFVFAGGGTAGHIVPGLAVAAALVDTGYKKDDILFMGSTKGMEKFLIPKAGYDIRLYDTKGLVRRLSLENFFKVLEMSADNSRSFLRALKDLRRIKPDLIVMLGGYAGLIPALAGLVLGAKVAVVNVDSVPGLSNRIVGRFAAVNTLPQAVPGVKRAVVTGTPIRTDAASRKNFLLQNDNGIRSSAIKVFFGTASTPGSDQGPDGTPGTRDPLFFTVMSGSLGAYSINKVLPRLVGAMAEKSIFGSRPLFVYHVTGERDFDLTVADCGKTFTAETGEKNGSGAKKAYKTELRKEGERKTVFSLLSADGSRLLAEYCLAAYEDRIPELMEASDLFLGRAGASTVAEIAAIGVPSVLVPLPKAPRDHQRENIDEMAKKGALIGIDDADLTWDNLFGLIPSLLGDGERRREMALRLYEFGEREAAATVAGLLSRLAGEGA